MSIGRAQDAAVALASCKQLSASNPAQEAFVADLLSQALRAAAAASLPPPQHHTHSPSAAVPLSAPASGDVVVEAVAEEQENVVLTRMHTYIHT